MHIQLYRCDHCGAERTSAPIHGDQWFELDVMSGIEDGWPRMRFGTWRHGDSSTHLCSRKCLRAWIEDFMEKQLEEKAKAPCRS
jgi:hypothetical protein